MRQGAIVKNARFSKGFIVHTIQQRQCAGSGFAGAGLSQPDQIMTLHDF